VRQPLYSDSAAVAALLRWAERPNTMDGCGMPLWWSTLHPSRLAVERTGTGVRDSMSRCSILYENRVPSLLPATARSSASVRASPS
jgi:hypothetical protein